MVGRFREIVLGYGPCTGLQWSFCLQPEFEHVRYDTRSPCVHTNQVLNCVHTTVANAQTTPASLVLMARTVWLLQGPEVALRVVD